MATNPVYGSEIKAAQADPNGPPGKTVGNVAGMNSQEAPAAKDPTAGSTSLVPPFLASPNLNPLEEVYGSVPEVGPGN